jgi:inner membrane protein
MSYPGIASRLYFFTSLTLAIGITLCALPHWDITIVYVFFVSCISCFVGGLPAFIVLLFTIEWVQQLTLALLGKLQTLALLLFTISLLYGLSAAFLPLFFSSSNSFIETIQIIAGVTAVLFACSCIATGINYTRLKNYLTNVDTLPATPSYNYIQTTIQNKNQQQMENNYAAVAVPEPQTLQSNKILIKGIITGALILVMLIPTVFISNLVSERESRQKEVVAEVSSKWATSQTITGPYLVIPYNETTIGEDKKPVVIRKSVVVLPDELNVQGNVLPEKRQRSIYTVLLYRSNLHAEGSFKPVIPSNINVDNLVFNEARLCIGLNDFKGIEEKVSINFNSRNYDLTPGLPTTEIDSTGLSCAADLTKDELANQLPFSFNLNIKGSERLHFVPLAGNSSFVLQSSWPNPSFDGNTLPTERDITDKGFTAKWSFNKANLPFNTVLKDFKLNEESYAFGVSMLQPADQYAKTSRSVKYAILFIGLTFSLFFIIELLQKRPVHPVQYVLVGLALIIFYSLLLSFSEFIVFNNAYLVAATATVLLISLYAKGHFASWKVAGVFAAVLASLYGFIFVLIQLEDTALLVGSIGLFGVIALVMYASRKINWYNPTIKTSPEIA